MPANAFGDDMNLEQRIEMAAQAGYYSRGNPAFASTTEVRRTWEQLAEDIRLHLRIIARDQLSEAFPELFDGSAEIVATIELKTLRDISMRSHDNDPQ